MVQQMPLKDHVSCRSHHGWSCCWMSLHSGTSYFTLLFTTVNIKASVHTFLLIASQHSCACQGLKSCHPAIHPHLLSCDCNMMQAVAAVQP